MLEAAYTKISSLKWRVNGRPVGIAEDNTTIGTKSILTVKNKIEAHIAGEKEFENFFIRFFLNLAAGAYSVITRIRAYFYKKEILPVKRLPCQVISVGNITAGGTGKTPLTIYISGLLSNLGVKHVIISRGYKGEAEKKGGIVSDGKKIFMDVKKAGDEPFMMANLLENVPVVVGKNRFDAGMLAVEKFNPDVILLDDAFQHMALARDINILLLDSQKPFGNGRLLPAGMLREPVSAVKRAHAVIFTRDDKKRPVNEICPEIIKTGLPVFRTCHMAALSLIYSSLSPFKGEITKNAHLKILKGKKVFAFSGIGKNHDFLETLKNAGCKITDFMGFSDHHKYSDADYKAMLDKIQEKDIDLIATTGKDYVKIPENFLWPKDLAVIDIRVSFGDDSYNFAKFIKKKILKQQ